MSCIDDMDYEHEHEKIQAMLNHDFLFLIEGWAERYRQLMEDRSINEDHYRETIDKLERDLAVAESQKDLAINYQTKVAAELIELRSQLDATRETLSQLDR